VRFRFRARDWFVRGRRYRGCVAEPHPKLATDAESDVAHALDRALVTWRYEPTRFVISRHPDGREREACMPDFYLPELDLYLEVSSGSPRRLNRKRAKLRRLFESHPGVRVELLGASEVGKLTSDPTGYLR
jgi:hypoxanthine phosphoribosyltransferase